MTRPESNWDIYATLLKMLAYVLNSCFHVSSVHVIQYALQDIFVREYIQNLERTLIKYAHNIPAITLSKLK